MESVSEEEEEEESPIIEIKNTSTSPNRFSGVTPLAAAEAAFLQFAQQLDRDDAARPAAVQTQHSPDVLCSFPLV